MATWVELTGKDGKREPVYVNLDQVTYLQSRNPGTRLFLSSGETTDVAEEPKEIVAKKAL